MSASEAGTLAVSAVIPAFNEADRIGATVSAITSALEGRFPGEWEVLVVDDGSRDDTALRAEESGARVLRMPQNRGKGAALAEGFSAARGRTLLMLDADLGESAGEALELLERVLDGNADMSIATFPRVVGGGFGLVKRLAAWGLRRKGAPPLQAPLSGQRALTRDAWERIGKLDAGFGLEMGLNLDAFRLGLRVVEVPTQLSHRLTGRDLAGFRHRGRQFRDILLCLLRRG
jgi:glycosyltransferase involved in cell wall biosynthesis